MNTFLKISFVTFVTFLVITNVKAADSERFESRFDVVACYKVKGCTGVDGKKTPHTIKFKPIKKKKDAYQASLTVKTKQHGEKFQAYVDIVKQRVKQNWIYTVTAYLKNGADRPTTVLTRNIRELNALVVKSKPRKKNKKSVSATFYFAPADTTLF